MRPRSLAPAALLAVAAALTACSNSSDRAGTFCARVRDGQALVTAGSQDPTQVGEVVSRYRSLEKTAPLAIQDDWRRLTDLVEMAAAIPAGDDVARTRLVSAAYEASGSVQNVVTWVRGTCGIDLATPVTTPAPPAPSPPSTSG